jgi:hypothetical protein
MIVKLKMDMKVPDFRQEDQESYGFRRHGSIVIPEGSLLRVIRYDRSLGVSDSVGFMCLETIKDKLEIRMSLQEFCSLTEDIREEGV